MTMMVIMISIITISIIAYAIKEFKPFNPETPETPETHETPEAHEAHNEVKEYHIDISSFEDWCTEHEDITGPTPEGTADFTCVAIGLNAGQFYVTTVIAAKEAKKLIAEAIAAEKVFFEQNKITLFEEETTTVTTTTSPAIETLTAHIQYAIKRKFGESVAKNILEADIYQVLTHCKDIEWLMQIKGIGQKRAQQLSAIIIDNGLGVLADKDKMEINKMAILKGYAKYIIAQHGGRDGMAHIFCDRFTNDHHPIVASILREELISEGYLKDKTVNTLGYGDKEQFKTESTRWFGLTEKGWAAVHEYLDKEEDAE